MARADPLQNGPNRADPFEVRISKDGSKRRICYVDSRDFRYSREFFNLDAAGGVYVGPTGDLGLYGGYHWRVDNSFRFAEFSAPDPETAITDLADAWVDLFEHDTFRGRRLVSAEAPFQAG